MSLDNCTICSDGINTTPYPNHNERWFVLSDEDNQNMWRPVSQARDVMKSAGLAVVYEPKDPSIKEVADVVIRGDMRELLEVV